MFTDMTLGGCEMSSEDAYSCKASNKNILRWLSNLKKKKYLIFNLKNIKAQQKASL